ncbi:Inward rectifier potassium channel, variant 2 [Parelaphostrongylus tenuis]|uniref:Inward rectifier potassium channel, variant 2 n=1 Tax=Parelaphostrongylus tenuis TaxID=148309 RepID=A0AAD5QFP9_PARTN|nr:Inward rectifier potassium channel, variant 2 [Parelaphostrongylus tenuis]
MRKATAVALSPSVANLLATQRMIDLEKPLVKSKKYPFFKTPRIGSRRMRNRLVQKQGICNISLKNVPKQRRKYFSDIFTTVIEMKWRWCLLYFSLSFVISWTFFASLYYSIGKHHGDVDNRHNLSWIPCIVNVHSEINAFLFSFTTQTTIGYGFRYPTDQCPLTIVTMCVQFMWGVMTQHNYPPSFPLLLQTLMAGIIFSKLARPIKRAATLIFSKNAVICMRDGKLCLLFRVGDMRKSSLAEAHIRLQMIKRCVTYEGELLPFHQFDMDVGYDRGLDRIFVIWPITICHEIDEMSPLYDIGEADLRSAKFEIIAILEGVVESVGSTTQARTSYLPSEILWGKRFEKLVHYKMENGQYNIDFCKFHNVYPVKTPSCSAKELDELRMRGQFDETEYQMYPPSDSRFAIISEDAVSPCHTPIEPNQTKIPMVAQRAWNWWISESITNVLYEDSRPWCLIH